MIKMRHIPMKRFFVFIALMVFSSPALFAQLDGGLPKGNVEVFDGFEKGNYWIWAGFDWDQYGTVKISTGANISKDWASEGSHSLEMTMDVMDAKSTKSAIWFYDGTNDLSGSRYLAMDFYNPENYTYQIAVVIQATDSWKWCSLGSYQLPPGVHTMVFSLSDYTEMLGDVRRISVTSDNGQILMKESHFYVDNIRLIK